MQVILCFSFKSLNSTCLLPLIEKSSLSLFAHTYLCDHMCVQVCHLNLALYVFFSCFLSCLLKQGLSLNTQLTNSRQRSEPAYPGGSISAPQVLGFTPRQGVTPTLHSHGAGDLLSGPYAYMVRTLFARPPPQLMTDFHISILYPMILFQSLLNSTVFLVILSESLQRWSCHLQRHFLFLPSQSAWSLPHFPILPDQLILQSNIEKEQWVGMCVSSSWSRWESFTLLLLRIFEVWVFVHIVY